MFEKPERRAEANLVTQLPISVIQQVSTGVQDDANTNMEKNILKIAIGKELEDITNPHLRCEVGRITASTLTLKVILPEEKIMKKLLTLYGNLPNVDAS